MIPTLLIANRGEIAIRVARTAAAMGIRTVAVYTADDVESLHRRHADLAVELPGTGVAGYLDIDALLGVARDEGCDAVHPGYGFLSESSEFAEACRSAGLIFVGPDPEVLARFGDKVVARDLAQSVGVTVTSGSGPLGTLNDALDFLSAQGGAPVMLKAISGGGGRGMRTVANAAQMSRAWDQARAEALGAFGAGDLYAERYLEKVRHIEVQIIGDGRDVTHLWERDCTLQRRHQKLVEIAPAPELDEDLRAALLEAAMSIGRAVRYRGIATVEFLVETGRDEFFFMEVNPRIQVEHTITEEITGLDLVALQLQIADGASLGDLGLTDGPRLPRGMALQARVNCEVIGLDGSVKPGHGRLDEFSPPNGPGVRVDTYGYGGYAINPAFDSLLAKVVVHERSGELGPLLTRAGRVLSEFRIEGAGTTLPYLRALLACDELATWSIDVNSIDRGLVDKLPDAETATAPVAQNKSLHLLDGVGALSAPMQGVVHSLCVSPGEDFVSGQELVILEAMKMQHVVSAREAGQVLELLCQPGDLVADGDVLFSYEPRAETVADTGIEQEIDLDRIRPDLAVLNERLALTLDENRPEAVARRRAKGQRTARENIEDLCQGGTFHEYGQLVVAGQLRRRTAQELREKSPADGIITGLGEINADLVPVEAAQVAILAYDGTVMAGTQGMRGHQKTDRLFEIAERRKLPVIFYTEGGGGRPGDVDFADIMRCALDVTTFHVFARLQGRGPKLTVNSGYCFAGNAAIFGAGDIRITTRNSWIGLGGPAMIEAGGIGSFGPKDIGPAPMQARIGLVDILAEDEAGATLAARQAMSYFQGTLAEWQANDPRLLRHLIPENRLRAYDIREVIDALVDIGSFLELGREHAPGMVTGLVRIEGRPLGLIANNPKHLGGALDAPASAKAARFLRLCARFRLPVLSLCDTPGFMVGPESEAQGGVQAACDFLSAGAELTAPLYYICLRKGYGIGAQAMAGGSFETPDLNISWPTGEFGPMGLEGAVTLGFKRELDAEPDEKSRQALFDRLVAESYEKGQALNIAALQEIDAVIDPVESRSWIVKGLNAAL